MVYCHLRFQQIVVLFQHIYYTLKMSSTATVSEVEALDAIYSSDALAAQAVRWNDLLTKFKETYSQAAEFVSRCPGRVNVIGEVG